MISLAHSFLKFLRRPRILKELFMLGRKGKITAAVLQSGLYLYFFKTENPRLINESDFKLRAGFNGAHTVYQISK